MPASGVTVNVRVSNTEKSTLAKGVTLIPVKFTAAILRVWALAARLVEHVTLILLLSHALETPLEFEMLIASSKAVLLATLKAAKE